MDGVTIQKFFSNEAQSMLDVYKNFETLIPSPQGKGAEHKGEDGRFVEALIRSFLAKYLPKELEVLTGFIVRPAVKRDKDRSREKEIDSHSTQLDIIVYNTAMYPTFMRYDNTVIVPPEGVVGVISVKKTLNDVDIEHELEALKETSKLCRDNSLRGPYLALVSMDNNINKKSPDTFEWIFNKAKSMYENDNNIAFDDTVGYIGALRHWSVFKKRPEGNNDEARYVLLEHRDNEYHLGLQFILTGLLSVYYDKSRTSVDRPGFTAFPSGRNHDRCLGSIKVKIPAKITKD